MAKKNSALVTQRGRAKISTKGNISPEQRESIIREAAYFRYLQRDPVPGHDIDDWLAAEAELFGEETEPQLPELIEKAEFGAQESGVHSFWEDDALKRIIKQHPRKGIPQVESIDPKEAPPKE